MRCLNWTELFLLINHTTALHKEILVAKLHYYKDCIKVLCVAGWQASLSHNGLAITIFPDSTASIGLSSVYWSQEAAAWPDLEATHKSTNMDFFYMGFIAHHVSVGDRGMENTCPF